MLEFLQKLSALTKGSPAPEPQGLRLKVAHTISTADERPTINAFHCISHERWTKGCGDTIEFHWLGHRLLKRPLERCAYQGIVYERQQRVIVEPTHALWAAPYFRHQYATL